jgi:hypothetical protein
MSRLPTPFQKKCLEELKEKLASTGIEVNRLEFIEGKEENFYEGEIDHVKFWIYIDGGYIASDVFERLYEPPDYKSADELILCFIKDLIRTIHEPRDQEKKKKPLFWRIVEFWGHHP